MPPFPFFRIALVYQSYPMHPKINPITRKTHYVQRQPRILRKTTPQCGVCRLQAIICRRQEAFSSNPGRLSRLPSRLSKFPEISARSNLQRSISHAPLTDLVHLGDVCPRLQQQLHHFRMILERSPVQRRQSVLRRAPPCQHPTPAPRPGTARVRPVVFKPPWS